MRTPGTSPPTPRVLQLLLLLWLCAPALGVGWIQVTNVWGGELDGELCVDPPAVDAQCGWRMIVNSDPPLTNIQAYQGVVSVTSAGKIYYVENESWNPGEPGTLLPYCTPVKIHGSFGNVAPTYVTVDWDCICEVYTCDPVASATVQTAAPTTPTPLATTTTPGATVFTTTPSIWVQGQSQVEGLFNQQEGLCHVAAVLPTRVSYPLRCYAACLRLVGCQGVNVEPIASGASCSFLIGAFDVNDLAASSSCTFWLRSP